MRSPLRPRIVLAVTALAWASPAIGQSARLPTDAEVLRARRQAVQWMLPQARPDGSFQTRYAGQHGGGVESLVALAAISAGEDPAGPALKPILAYLNKVAPGTVYARSIRALLYASLAETPETAKRLADDVEWLVKNVSPSGGWGYGPGHPTSLSRPRWVDASNSQLAALAISAARRRGADVPARLRESLANFWLKTRNADGGWGYTPPDISGIRLRDSSYGAMSAAGAATLANWQAVLATDEPSASDVSVAIAKALGWINAQDKLLDAHPGYWGTGQEYVYFWKWCLARAGNATGTRTLGKLDWTAAIAIDLLARQRPDGSWGLPETKPQPEDLLRTAYALLALAETARPVAVQVLTDDDALPDIQAIDRLTALASLQLDMPVSWRRVTVDAPARDQAEAPLLYVRAEPGNPLDELILAAVTQHAGGTGTVLVQADSPNHAESLAAAIAARLPGARAVPLSDAHPLASKPRAATGWNAQVVTSLGRVRAVVSADDLARAWAPSDDPAPALAGTRNILAAAAAAQPLRGPFAARAPAPKGRTVTPARNVAVARVQHAGRWNLCPKAMAGVSDALARAISVGVADAEPTDLTAPVPQSVRLLWITGTDKLELSAAQRENLKAYVQAGGTVFIDSGLGDDTFVKAASEVLTQTFGPDALVDVAPDDPLSSGSFSPLASDVSRAKLLGYEGTPPSGPSLRGVRMGRRLGVILSAQGVTCPMGGSVPLNLKGLIPADANRLAMNVVLYALANPKTRQIDE